MTDKSERFRRADQLFDTALDLPAGQRTDFVRARCGDDADLCADVLNLLDAHQQSAGFLEASALELAEPFFDESALLDATRPARIGHFRIVSVLGRGGMGEVYVAERDDGQFEQRVALKLISRGSVGMVGRFYEERRILARLEHPHIARLVDGGITADGWPFFAMELVLGEPIDRYCEINGLSVDERLALVIAVCDAVSYAHQHLVIHRDLKPSNILVDAGGHVKLLDFGIAKVIGGVEDGDDRTRTGMYVLTPDFAAPEQLRGEAVSTTTDVYALGVLLYILLTGKRPHHLRGKSPAEMERIVLEQEPARPSSLGGPALRRRLRGDLDAIVMKALRPEPARRYATVAELRDDLLRERAGVPVQARPTSAGYRLRKFASRNRAVVAAAMVTLLVLVGATAFSAAQMREAQRQRDAAQVDLKRQQAMSELQSVLASDSRGVDGRPLTALARIALAERVVMRRFAAEPWLMLELLAELSTRMYEFGDRPTQRRMLDRALAIALRADLPAQRALIECLRAYSFTYDDQFDSARTILARARGQLAQVRGHSFSAEGHCSQAEAQLLVAENRSDEAITLLTRSLARLPAGNASLRQGTLFELANALRAAGRSRESAAYHRQLVDELVQAGYNGTDILANEFSWLAPVLNDLGELATLDSLTRALIREQTEVQHIYSSGLMDFHVGQTQLRMGNADTAEVWLARAQRDTTEGAGGLIAWLPPALAYLRLEQGRLSEARRHLAGLPTGTHTRRVNAAWFGAWLRYTEGDRRGAMQMLEDSLGVLRAGDGKPAQTLAMPYVLAAQWRLADGDARGADSLALLARTAATVDSVTLERSGYVGRAELVRARALYARAEATAARAAAGRAVTALTNGFGATNRYTSEARAFRDSISP